MIQWSILFESDRKAKIKLINKVYGGPLLKLIHYRHLRLKLTISD